MQGAGSIPGWGDVSEDPAQAWRGLASDLALPPRLEYPRRQWFRRMRIGVLSAWNPAAREGTGHILRAQDTAQPATWAGGLAQFENAVEPGGRQEEDRGCPSPADPR